ncbi:hypothetical protein V6N13_107528 [Hibiscus sabdariffa]|uniref:Uncharacterized protein n=1 Tax=Hibiscus sabdariffa TaxID=183260 RepID=A0ABR2SQH5_9ROSI
MPIATSSTSSAQPCSTWHCPMPYLFGGMASMLGLVGFTPLILACSYCRHSRGVWPTLMVESDEKDGNLNKNMKVYDENILVIMAGDGRPTFLATSTSAKASSFDGF